MVVPLVGDVTKPNLGLKQVPQGISSLYHLAATVQLGADKDGSIWGTNVTGTENVIKFCLDHNIPHLFFCSTAYTIDDGRNAYEKSKIHCERLINQSGIPKVTIFKPSVIMGTRDNPFFGHYSQFGIIMMRVHRRAEIVRRKLEGTLRLPIIEPVFRVKANPEGHLNLVIVDKVAEAMAEIEDTGTYWLTNPNPNTLGQVIGWIGEFILVNIKVEPEFKPTPLERLYQKKVNGFSPYLQGDSFPSHLKDHPAITKEFALSTLTQAFFAIDSGK